MSASFKIDKEFVVEMPTTNFRETGVDDDGYPITERFETTGHFVECHDGFFREVWYDEETDCYYGSCIRSSIKYLPEQVEVID